MFAGRSQTRLESRDTLKRKEGELPEAQDTRGDDSETLGLYTIVNGMLRHVTDKSMEK